MERRNRVPGFPVLPAVFLVASVAMLAAAFASEPGIALLDATVILAGVPAYFLARRAGARRLTPPPSPSEEG